MKSKYILNLKTRVQSLPAIIQGGMGISVSNWRLARAVSLAGQLGVISGTAIEAVHARILSLGDPKGILRKAYASFPDQKLVSRVMARYFNESGKKADDRYHSIPMFKLQPSQNLLELIVLSNFAEVRMAKGDQDLNIGVNYLQKIEVPTPAAIFGAMLAGVDVVLMGAGIPSQIPQLLNDLSDFKAVEYPVKVIDAPNGKSYKTAFDPSQILDINKAKIYFESESLKRPVFLAIVSSDVLAYFLAKSEKTKPDGYIVEGPTAGGHNAPPRGKIVLDDSGQPIYGPRDTVDFDKLVNLKIPFWMAGGYGSPDKFKEALSIGANGIQVGSAFAVCAESGMESSLKSKLIQMALDGSLIVRTEPYASPSGYPFKVGQVEGTLSEAEVVSQRPRRCDLGYLREAVYIEGSGLKFRCPAEPIGHFEAKHGKVEETEGRVCLCNGLMATAGFPQIRIDGDKHFVEPPVITIGDDLIKVSKEIVEYLQNDVELSDHSILDMDQFDDEGDSTDSTPGWNAAQVIEYLLSGLNIKSNISEGALEALK